MPASGETPDHRRLLRGFIGLAALFTLYAASIVGIRHSNEGAHYALVRAFADRTVVIDDHVDYTRGVDAAFHNGHWYSDRPPGTAALAMPFYLAGRVLGGQAATDRLPAPFSNSGLPPDSVLRVPPIEEYTTTLLAALAGVVTVALAFAVSREIGAGRGPSLLIAAGVGLGSMVWRYSTTLFNHSITAAILIGSIYVALRARKSEARRTLVLLGLLLGAGLAVEYTMIIPATAISLTILTIRWRRAHSNLLRDLAALAAGAAFPVALLAIYQTVAFGSPFLTSYSFKINQAFAFSRSFLTVFGGPIGNIWPMLFDLRQGVVPWNPLLLLAPFGFWALWKRDREAGVLFILAVVPLLLLLAKFPTWEGGATQDSRYVTPLLPLMFVPVALFLERARGKKVRFPLASVLVGAGVLLQSIRVVRLIGREERFGGGPGVLTFGGIDLSQGIKQFFRAAFPSARYVPVTAVIALAVAYFSWRLVMRRAARRSPLDPSRRQISPVHLDQSE